MLGEIVSTMTPDQVRLHGFYALPTDQAIEKHPSRAILLVHGLAGNFYGSPFLLQLARRFLDRKCAVLLGNTRGHDYLNATVRVGRTRTLGAAVEIVSEGTDDIAGWVQYLLGQGHSQVVLVGHSLGAIKSLFSQAHRSSPEVQGIVALSPTRLNFDQFMASRRRPKFEETIARAEEAVAAGRGEELLAVEFPFPTWISATAYLNKYGAGNPYDWTQFLDQVQQPALITFGQLELDDNPALEGLRPELERLVTAGLAEWLPESFSDTHRLATGTRQIAIIPRADHFYVAAYDRVADLAITWIERQIARD